MEGFLFSLLLFLTVTFVLTQAVIVWLIDRSGKRHTRDHLVDHAVAPETRAKSEAIIHEAIEKADKIVTEAELTGVKTLATERQAGERLAKELRGHLDTVEAAFEAEFKKSASTAESAYTQFIATLEEAMKTHITTNEKLLETKADQMIGDTRKLMSDLTTSVQSDVRKQVEEELKSAQQEITTYKQQRMRVVDERIIDMLEDVIKVTLEKKLSLVEQSELVYKALEEAKRENLFK
ncbi:hypothetical protein A2Z33_04340 [Candidatus Gottesmanbacteria bacterium RBG_16_52_11]|uniref:Uncharacterized protein n=1 Tax=Candidatus Gottesmanbacteria bacterium RBG_16_52_11 TaxID=1798374 RepID=A0A1F5YW77_9BACT|nr:MAG: hypothetical protein A2Z33_04340 [Candidatus Gottesmanbacteria bacterium RBG_16_52_11]